MATGEYRVSIDDITERIQAQEALIQCPHEYELDTPGQGPVIAKISVEGAMSSYAANTVSVLIGIHGGTNIRYLFCYAEDLPLES